MSTVQPYPLDTQWIYRLKRDPSVEHTTGLVLYAEPDACWITDNYTADEITARELWDQWTASDIYQDAARTQVHISWYVTTPEFSHTFEGAPFRSDRKDFAARYPEDFLTFFSWPEHAETSEPVNWLRLPVADRGWSEDRSNKGGFIQEVLGWKPAPLQPLMDVPRLALAAGLDYPTPSSATPPSATAAG